MHAVGRSRRGARSVGRDVSRPAPDRAHAESVHDRLSADDRDPPAPRLEQLPDHAERGGLPEPPGPAHRAIPGHRHEGGARPGQALPARLGRGGQRLREPAGALRALLRQRSVVARSCPERDVPEGRGDGARASVPPRRVAEGGQPLRYARRTPTTGPRPSPCSAIIRAGILLESLAVLPGGDPGALRLQDVDVNDVIQEVIHIVEPEAARRGVVVSADRRRTTLAVRADQVHLQQAMLNLAMNGMDAMLNCVPGRRRLAFQAAVIGESDVEVSVSDTGTGIPEEKLKGMFDSFVTTKPEGTGLGLSIARTIVETYGGKIWAENGVGGGAVFRFSLPLVKAQAA